MLSCRELECCHVEDNWDVVMLRIAIFSCRGELECFHVEIIGLLSCRGELECCHVERIGMLSCRGYLECCHVEDNLNVVM